MADVASGSSSALSAAAPTLADGERSRASWQPVDASFPGLSRVCADPPVYEIEGFLTPAEVETVLAAGVPGLRRSIVVDGTAGKSAAPSRTSESCYLDKAPFRWLAERVAALTGKAPETQEPCQVARYRAGQFYLAHFDAFDVTTAPGRECVATGGQRVATVLIYLNSLPPGAGGETTFPRLGRSFTPKLGKALVFFPCTTDGLLDPMALHAAESVAEGGLIKLVAQIWVRQGVFAQSAPAAAADAPPPPPPPPPPPFGAAAGATC